MSNPKVSFVVPCYKLAGFLPTCINSILRQSYTDFEILIMDDCSPDNTGEVAQSFSDPRIRYIRNDPNLGHLRNYNRGIELSRGAYIWLISADDYLRSNRVLQRYVERLDRSPEVGYVFCTGYGVRDGIETDLLGQLQGRGDRDRVLSGKTLLKKLLSGNFVLTPSGMVRRECYEKVSKFPLDMPWCGDWYLWCLFALHYDVGYFAEPMVCYRQQHSLSMTEKLTGERLEACASEEIRVPWTIREHALRLGRQDVARLCIAALADTYARTLADQRYLSAGSNVNFERMENSLQQQAITDLERDCIRARVYATVGNKCYWRHDVTAARHFYRLALAKAPWRLSVLIKLLLISLGRPGHYVRRSILSAR
ncbi:glycosyltransferase family 2 protein [Azohydromonas caseinilytica]|uniref:Glycosyltransferase n=1 Tax=Azohydromonas caseinilytica TaxID=2728836 RepID=A0A848FL87_9BURK|nr:glycosyltransferase [Azohydromonas caseinilytica]NML18993.1 glycosyltransferase [Azohydromonas caseinilytica]